MMENGLQGTVSPVLNGPKVVPLDRPSLRHQALAVRYGHGGGGSRKINAWHIYALMVYL
jgi:hypothetical protein